VLRALRTEGPRDVIHVRRSADTGSWCIHHDAGWTHLWAPTKLAALSVGLRLARTLAPSRLLVHGPQGRVELQREYEAHSARA
jgi:hypothetical protein